MAHNRTFNQLTEMEAQINKMANYHHIKIGSILKLNGETLNFCGTYPLVNLTTLSEKSISEIETYINYVSEQERSLLDIEKHADELRKNPTLYNQDN